MKYRIRFTLALCLVAMFAFLLGRSVEYAANYGRITKAQQLDAVVLAMDKYKLPY